MLEDFTLRHDHGVALQCLLAITFDLGDDRIELFIVDEWTFEHLLFFNLRDPVLGERHWTVGPQINVKVLDVVIISCHHCRGGIIVRAREEVLVSLVVLALG